MPRQKRFNKPPLDPRDVRSWAWKYFRSDARWPTDQSGPVAGQFGLTWSAINSAFLHGMRGLPKTGSLARFLDAEFHEERAATRPGPLSYQQIIDWAVDHNARTGKWPKNEKGPVLAAPNESWQAIRVAIKQGHRGLPGGTTLARLLHRYRGVPLDPRSMRDRPPLTIRRILEWAQDFHNQTGRWPSSQSGPVDGAAGETWHAIDAALLHGGRGLPGGNSLSRLLNKQPGSLRRLIRPRLTYQQVLDWADAFYARKGIWPSLMVAERIPESPGDTWTTINAAMMQGWRGLPKGLSLADLLAKHRGRPKRAKKQWLAIADILKWADEHHARSGRWPTLTSDRIAGSDETWSNVNAALKTGGRGLPGGESLAQLLTRRRNKPYHEPRIKFRTRPPLTTRQIIRWAQAHFERTGQWPVKSAGRVAGTKDETWSAVNSALIEGLRGLPGGSSLAKLLDEHVPATQRRPSRRPPLDRDKVLIWAADHCKRTHRWPGVQSGPIPGSEGDTWYGVNKALRQGRRGLPGGTSLREFLCKHVGQSVRATSPPLTYRQITEWAEAWKHRTGSWPTSKTPGHIEDGYGDPWGAIHVALVLGYRGLPGGMTLSRLLGRTKGSLRSLRRPLLTISQILQWADAHHAPTGQWPRSKSGLIEGTNGETWQKVDSALFTCTRGIRQRTSLARLLARHRGAPLVKSKWDAGGPAGAFTPPRRRLRTSQILLWARAHYRRHGAWPDAYSGRIPDALGETWLKIDEALRAGDRGLRAGPSLRDLLARRPAPRPFPFTNGRTRRQG